MSLGAVSYSRNITIYLIINEMKEHLMNIVKGVKKNLKTYIKMIILIFSMMVASLFIATVITFNCASTTANAQTISAGTGQTEINIDVKNVPVATSGDAGYMSKPRSVTDIYNVCVLILFLLVFWVIWNVIRTVYRVFSDFKRF